MVKGWQVLSDGTFSCRSCVLSFPLCGNGLPKPLDSSLRWNDGKGDSGLRRAAMGILSSRRIQDVLSINDGGDWVRNLSEWQQIHSDLRSHSSESLPTGLLPINNDGCSTFAQAFLGVLEQGREEVVHHAPFAELDLHRHGHAGAEVDLGIPNLNLRLRHPHAG